MQEYAHPEPVAPEQLEGELLTLRYVPLSAARFWDRNPKLHDIQKLVESIELHGFKDPPAYDAALEGFVEGNGRTEAMQWMVAHNRRQPRGVAIDTTTSEWCIPVLFGVDAASRLAAERYGIDHNNLTMAGGDYTATEMARQWSSSYIEVMKSLGEADMLPVSVDGDDLDELIAAALASDDEAPPLEPSDGSLLELTNVTIDAPRNEVETGDVWDVGGHTLIIIDVITGWPMWSPYLTGDDAIFVPYPGPFAPLTLKANKHRMIMVQPDKYVAGHILDRYQEINGVDSIRKS